MSTDMKITKEQLRQIIREEIQKENNNWSKEDQLTDDLISAYKWAFGKVWEKAKKLPPNDPQYKKLFDKMEDLSDEIDKLVKKQHQKK